jgi:type II secretory pathway pseudopilin PulG
VTHENLETLKYLLSMFALCVIVCGFATLIVNAWIRSNENKRARQQRGFVLLLELLVVVAITAILLSMSVIPVMRIRAVEQTTQAKQRLIQVLNASVVVSLCAIPANSCSSAAVQGLIPPAGTMVIQGFRHQMVQVDANIWQLTATPLAVGFTGTTGLYISNSDGILRCNINGTATAASAPC